MEELDFLDSCDFIFSLKRLSHLDFVFKGTYSEAPKIVQRGTWTQAAPFKEHKYYRHVSDSIANNYSPDARELTTSVIYEQTKFGKLEN